MFNLVKNQQVYPDIFQVSNISSFYKNKGAKNDLNNDRGVFNVVKLRSILDKLIYNSKYEIIDQNMSCSNIGGRKNKNIRDHLFVINGIINDVIKSEKEDVEIQIVDVMKCFDKLWYAETANDLYSAGVVDDQFVTIANSNKNCQVAVKTPWGALTERKNLQNIEMQGTVITSIKCSLQIDTLGKECLSSGEGLFKYKECLPVPPLGLVDDVLGIAKCGTDSIKLNSIIQSKMSTKRLKMGPSKCFQIHVGKQCSDVCPQLFVHNNPMKRSNSEKYLGDILSNNGKIDENIEARYQKGIGVNNTIFSLLQEISFGEFYFEMGTLFRSSMLINSVLCSSEVLYGIKSDHIDTLEKCDKLFFSKIFGVPNSCAYESFFLETGAIPIRFIIIGRRLIYYWTLLNKSEDELAKKFLKIQKQFPVCDDWILQVEENLKFCEIDLSEDQIKNMKKNIFKNIVKNILKQKLMNIFLL